MIEHAHAVAVWRGNPRLLMEWYEALHDLLLATMRRVAPGRRPFFRAISDRLARRLTEVLMLVDPTGRVDPNSLPADIDALCSRLQATLTENNVEGSGYAIEVVAAIEHLVTAFAHESDDAFQRGLFGAAVAFGRAEYRFEEFDPRLRHLFAEAERNAALVKSQKDTIASYSATIETYQDDRRRGGKIVQELSRADVEAWHAVAKLILSGLPKEYPTIQAVAKAIWEAGTPQQRALLKGNKSLWNWVAQEAVPDGLVTITRNTRAPKRAQ